jgi:hypothetical protein
VCWASTANLQQQLHTLLLLLLLLLLKHCRGQDVALCAACLDERCQIPAAHLLAQALAPAAPHAAVPAAMARHLTHQQRRLDPAVMLLMMMMLQCRSSLCQQRAAADAFKEQCKSIKKVLTLTQAITRW